MLKLTKGDTLDFKRGDLAFYSNRNDVYFITSCHEDCYRLSEKLEIEDIFRRKNMLMCIEREKLSVKFLRSCESTFLKGIKRLKDIILFFYEIIEEQGCPIGLKKLDKEERKTKIKEHKIKINERESLLKKRRICIEKNIDDHPLDVCKEFSDQIEDLLEKIDSIKTYYKKILKYSCDKHNLSYDLYSEIFEN